MQWIKYDNKDLLAIRNGTKTRQEIADKYGVSVHAIRCAMSRAKIYERKTAVLMTTPYQTKIFSSISECAEAIGVSQPTITKALRGKRSQILEVLEIKVEVYVDRYAEEEYDD